jgi:hypothetical protein
MKHEFTKQASTQIPSWMVEAFQIIDQMDARSFARLITPNGRMRFGNGPFMEGREAIEKGVDQFFGSLRGISHRLERAWVLPDAHALQGRVTYTRPDGKSVDIPFTDVFVMAEDGLVKEWLVYSDMAPLFSP